MVALAVVFIAVLFFIKIKAQYEKQPAEQAGLSYQSEKIEDLVNKDTDSDGVADWEERLWGTDPTKKDTDDDGVPDGTEIEKLKTEQEKSNTVKQNEDDAKLTQTDEFSREFFTTVAAATQGGGQPIDQATMDKISSSLADHIQNYQPRKTYLLSDLKIVNDDSQLAIRTYDYALRDIYAKYPITGSVSDILQEFASDQTAPKVEALAKLDPIISQTNKIVAGIAKTSVPRSLALLDLNLLNTLERLNENLSDFKLYNTDAIVALSAAVQYDQNNAALATAANNLTAAIKQKW